MLSFFVADALKPTEPNSTQSYLKRDSACPVSAEGGLSGIHITITNTKTWIPAFASMTGLLCYYQK